MLAADRAGAAVGDSATLLSMSITNGAPVAPGSVLAETWTFQNTGTNTWEAASTGYTLYLIGLDCLGITPLFTNDSGACFTPSAIIGSGKNIAPGQTAGFSIDFIAPEAAGSYTDSFSLNNSSGAIFGPIVTLQVNVANTGNTNVYDRCRAISFANNYADYYCPDGYFWTNGDNYSTVNPDQFIVVPTSTGIGEDCAHFVSYCIGKGPYARGGGINLPSRLPPAYGEPGAPQLINNLLLAPGYAVEVSSLSRLEPGDVIGWNWNGDTNLTDIDHVTLYMGNHLLSCHSASALDVDPTYFQNSEPDWVWHLIHILDYPVLWTSRSGNNMTLMWTTNWSGYALYSAPGINGPWTKISAGLIVTGVTNSLTLTPSTGTAFYRLEMP